jgi:adenylate kinase
VKDRLGVFFDRTVPILDYYEKLGKLIRVNGNLGVQRVARDIISALKAGTE